MGLDFRYFAMQHQAISYISQFDMYVNRYLCKYNFGLQPLSYLDIWSSVVDKATPEVFILLVTATVVMERVRLSEMCIFLLIETRFIGGS